MEEKYFSYFGDNELVQTRGKKDQRVTYKSRQALKGEGNKSPKESKKSFNEIEIMKKKSLPFTLNVASKFFTECLTPSSISPCWWILLLKVLQKIRIQVCVGNSYFDDNNKGLSLEWIQEESQVQRKYLKLSRI